MTEEQGWVLLGIVAAALLAGPTVLSLYVRTAMRSVERNMEKGFLDLERNMNTRFEALNARLDAVDRRLTRVEQALRGDL